MAVAEENVVLATADALGVLNASAAVAFALRLMNVIRRSW